MLGGGDEEGTEEGESSSWCEVCGELRHLLRHSEEDSIDENSVQFVLKEGPDLISKGEIGALYRYLNAWVSNRQCHCLFKEPGLPAKFANSLESLIGVGLHLIKNLGNESASSSSWNPQEVERLLQFLSKVFMLQFPLYSGFKHSGLRPPDVSQAEATQLAVYCDHHDASSDFPLSLLRNVSLFCKSGGLQGMANAFKLSPSALPLPLAHALISILCNVKLWLNYRALLQLFTPVRTNALNYMCQLEDSDLRQNSSRHMSDFLWSCVKENLDSPISFDKDGLELALKYFTSSTLTMRLAGISQINSHVNLFNEMCNTESVVEVENVGLQLAAWVLNNGVVEHIFGPNLHVEIIKQSHILLNFLAVEGKISNSHIGVVWQAAQLKHCSKQVHDLLLPLIKNLEAGPVLHLYELLKSLPIREHTEQTIHIAQVLQKFIWTSGGTFNHLISQEKKSSAAVVPLKKEEVLPGRRRMSSSEEDEVKSTVDKDDPPVLVEVVLKPSDKKSSSSSEEGGGDFGIDDLDEDDLNEYSDDEDEEDDEMAAEDLLRKSKGEKNAKEEPPATLTASNKDDDKKEEAATPPGIVVGEEGEQLKAAGTPPSTDTPSKESKGVKRSRLPEDPPGSSEDSEGPEDPSKTTSSPAPEVNKKLRMSSSEKSSSSPLSLVKGISSAAAAASPWWQQNASAAATAGPIRWPSGSAMTELANLVNAHPTGGSFGIRSPEMEMRPFLRSGGGMEEGGFSGDDSVSSRLSNKSDKNLADFEDETSVEEEMAASQPTDISAVLHHQQQLASLYHQHQHHRTLAAAASSNRRPKAVETDSSASSSHYKLESACEPGNTLLWDLLQDGNIEHLAEGLATEAEKALTSLLCFNMERFIRMKFVEGCLNNVARNVSVVISLRLLPKLFQSFQHFRGMDTHEVSMYAERKFGMTNLFFNNLQVYFKSRQAAPDEEPQQTHTFFNHLAQVQVRLQFLGVLFSIQVSPIDFRLSNGQIHILWECLAGDPISSDDLFQWLLIQAHSKEQHAIGLDGFRLIYNDKIPLIKPETISMLGLNLFSQLCQLSRITKQNNADDEGVKMDQLWRIALCAQNTDVSMKAIQILNTAYFGQGEEFLITCMKSLCNASNDLEHGKDETLIRIQRALLLLKTYLETFRRKYAYHFRRLSIEGLGVSTHAELVELRSIGSIRVVVQAAGFQDKVTFEMQPMDLVADLRAEICAWWEGKRRDKSPLAMLNDEGPLRIITQGQEITFDTDEKSLLEMGFKDLQMVFVSQGAHGSSRASSLGRNTAAGGDLPPFPGKDKMPMNLLLNPIHFEQLFSLMTNLSSLQIDKTKAQILSRRVWDILMLLPTNFEIREKLLTIEDRSEEEIRELLSPASPQKLMYTFYIVDWLGRPARLRRHSGVLAEEEEASGTGGGNAWITKFISAGGLRHLFDIFTSGVLQCSEEGRVWCEWKQDCLSALIKLLVQFGVDSEDYDALADQIIIEDMPNKKKNLRSKRTSNSGSTGNNNDRLLVPRLSATMLGLMSVDVVMPRITSVLLEVSRVNPNQYRTGVFGRPQVVHFCLSLLVAWIYSVEDVEDALLSSNGLPAWLRHLVLEDHDPAVRREMCTGLYKLCMGSTTSGKTGVSVTGPMLSILLEFLDDALLMQPVKREGPAVEEGKEPFGPACRDYFWILCRLTDILRSEGLVDLDQLSRQLACGLVSRKFYEKRHGDPSPDDALVGTLNLLCAVMKHQPAFKASGEGRDFLLHLWECLFALPSPLEKDRPKCKSQASRTACYDLLVEMVKGSLSNYLVLHEKLMAQHGASAHKPYQWEYWPRDDGRAECGYVGLTNLGATCYMATCVQQLYMIPEARSAILRADLGDGSGGKHANTLYELQRMFAYLRDSERKAYNPLSFCKTYQMDHQPLNTGEQKDMAEFFIDLLSKIEEMTPDIKHVVKDLFCGNLTNNVVSLDCSHVSKTIEEFYTVRCQVSELRNLHQSLEEVTVKDTLEGDNMYTCSQCGKKVRAEKRACFKKLPKILAFNTMRYTFNMITMLKEKVNTHFSFPFCLDMSPYMEKNLIPSKGGEEEDESNGGGYEYEIIGVTVHTGTADGGHYYAFIRSSQKDKWYSFNDAEVKPFDQNQIASECFGGEMNSRTYDQVTDKFMDLSIEKTNSAYMLFYERVEPTKQAAAAGPSTSSLAASVASSEAAESPPKNIDLSQSLEEWIWQDNMNFIQDNNIFDHTYFNFMWQMVGSIPTTISGQKANEDITLLSGKLATSFFLESFIHAKEKLNIVQWVELLTKQFDSSTAACSWFLNHMARDNHWPVTIFLKCQVQTIRQMFHRLCIHVIQKLRPMEKELYIEPWSPKGSDERYPSEEIRSRIGSSSPITRFIRMLLRLLESGSARPHLKHLTELFRFLYDFSKLGEEESNFLLSVNTISVYADFYLKAIKQGGSGSSGAGGEGSMITIDVISDEDEDEDEIIALTPVSAESSKMASLDKMVCLIALLVEKSRGHDDNLIHLSESDRSALVGGKSLVFLFNITKDNINTCQTVNLIFSLTRNNPELAEQVSGMVFAGVKTDYSMHFFRLLTLLTEFSGGPSGMPCFTNLVMHKVWDLAKTCPQAALDWLSIQVSRNRYVQSWLLSSLEDWVESYLIAHPNQKVRNSASFLVVSLVPSNHFRQAFRTAGRASSVALDAEEREVLHQVLEFLFGLLPNCRHYAELQEHGSAKLVAYFQTMSHFLLGRTEKLMFEPHFLNLWQLFHPKLSEPSIPIHHNKQALLNFWYNLCLDCKENVLMILSNPNVTKNIAFNYILADHEDTEVINFNRIMLPTYYGLLRLCCLQSRSFSRVLSQHQNIHWAFKNITPYTTQYTVACDELFKLMGLFVQKSSSDPENDEDEEIRTFRHQTLQLYLSILDGRSSWSTLINALKILVDSNEDRIFVVYNNGLALIFDALNMLHMMLHEATACHVTGELIQLLTLFLELVKAVRSQRNNGEIRTILSRWKDMSEMTGRLLTLCNSFNPPELRNVCLCGVKEMLLLWPGEMLNILVPMLHRAHTNSSDMDSVGLGPYFPRKGSPPPANIPSLKAVRPPRPMFQMAVPASQLLSHHGQDPEYDWALQQYFGQYHAAVDLMVRVAVNENNLTKMLVDLSAMVGLDGVSLHMQLFPKLWTDIHNTQLIDRKFILMLISSHGFLEYVDAVLLDERSSLNNPHIFNFLLLFFPKVSSQVLTDQVQSIISQLVSNFIDMSGTFVLERLSPVRHLNGDLRALFLVSSSSPRCSNNFLSPRLHSALKDLCLCVEKKLEGRRPSEEELGGSSKDDQNEEDVPPGKSLLEDSCGGSSQQQQHCSISTDIDNESELDKKSSDELRKSPDVRLMDSLGTLYRTLTLLIQICEKKLGAKRPEGGDEERGGGDPKETEGSSSSKKTLVLQQEGSGEEEEEEDRKQTTTSNNE